VTSVERFYLPFGLIDSVFF